MSGKRRLNISRKVALKTSFKKNLAPHSSFFIVDF